MKLKPTKNEWKSKNLLEFILLLREKKSQKSSREETGVYKSASSMLWSDVDIIVSFTCCQELLQNLYAFRGILGKGRENQHHSQCWEQSKMTPGPIFITLNITFIKILTVSKTQVFYMKLSTGICSSGIKWDLLFCIPPCLDMRGRISVIVLLQSWNIYVLLRLRRIKWAVLKTDFRTEINTSVHKDLFGI